MKPNPILRKLGLADTDRVVIIHVDDLGMCQASISAFAELADFGLVSSAAVMVPCPWFLEAAAYCREHPGVDVGVHSTLTSEWKTYRWGPVSTRDPASGLLDAEGYLFATTPGVHEHVDAQAALVELRAQVERALAAGIDVTHIDTHMGVVMHPGLMPLYIQLGLEVRVPPMVVRLDQAGLRAMGAGETMAASAAAMVEQLEEQGLPMMDYVAGMPLDQPDDQVALAKQMLSSLPAGLTHFILHPSSDTPELRAITPDWPSRVACFRAFMSPELRNHVRKAGIKVVGYRMLRDLMRGTH